MPHYMGYWKINDFKRTWQRHIIWPWQPHVPKKVFTECSLRFHSSGIRDHLISLGDRVLARRRARKVDIKTSVVNRSHPLLCNGYHFIYKLLQWFVTIMLLKKPYATNYYDITAIITPSSVWLSVYSWLLIFSRLKTFFEHLKITIWFS